MVTNKFIRKSIKLLIVVTVLLTLPIAVFAQANGDNLAFQGLANTTGVGVKAFGMGSAFTSMKGELDAIFYNPAGLSGIEKIQLSVSGKYSSNLWRENQVWWAGRRFHSGNFILDGMVEPDPSMHGRWADTLYYFDLDKFVLPEGDDEYSEDVADWQYTNSNSGLNYISAAVPIGERFVVAASYNKSYDVNDYDRNDTYLDPHFGKRNDPRVKGAFTAGDTLHMNWFTYERVRTGGLYNISGAVSFKLMDNINLGLGFNTLTGETDDNLFLGQRGSFDIVPAGTDIYRFFFNDSTIETTGNSKFSGLNFNFGAIFSFNRFNVGFNLKLPYTLKREWNYTTKLIQNSSETNTSSSGTDEVDLPFCYSIGVSMIPHERVTVALDVEKNGYSGAEYRFSDDRFSEESLPNPKWPDQLIYRLGAEYRAFKILSFLAGFQNIPQAFVPQGAPFREEGPSAKSITFGGSLKILRGRLDVVYEYRNLKYYDVYENNQNYVYGSLNNVFFGYTLVL